ncbi:hypothetical protein ACMGE9_02560 [Macrococcus sp. EM39E]|uniref:hypothetical protein n=1 Tax=Macrococcus animalis TaxID=3395467 RepID=UPI0039BE0AD3
MNYHKIHSIDAGDDLELDDTDFFNIDGAIDMNVNDALEEYTQLSYVVSINAIIDKVYQVGTIKQQYMFMCMLRGMNYERIGDLFSMSSSTVKVYIDRLLDKVIEDSH